MIGDLKMMEKCENSSAQKDLLSKNLSEVDNIRCDVLKYEQKLNRERLKCRALEETLLKPTNVHRWRLLKVIFKQKYIACRTNRNFLKEAISNKHYNLVNFSQLNYVGEVILKIYNTNIYF